MFPPRRPRFESVASLKSQTRRDNEAGQTMNEKRSINPQIEIMNLATIVLFQIFNTTIKADKFGNFVSGSERRISTFHFGWLT
jgi:hypothetical protein